MCIINFLHETNDEYWFMYCDICLIGIFDYYMIEWEKWTMR